MVAILTGQNWGRSMERRLEVDDYYRSRLEAVTESGIVFTSRGCLIGAILDCDGGDSGATLYEGENASGRKIAHISGLDSTSTPWELPIPSYLELGLYVALDDGNAELTVQYFPTVQKMSE